MCVSVHHVCVSIDEHLNEIEKVLDTHNRCRHTNFSFEKYGHEKVKLD